MVTPQRLARIQWVLDRRQPDLTVIMEDVNKAHNLAAIARSCDAVGIGEIHAVSSHPKVSLTHRVAAGCSRWVEVRCFSGLEEVMTHLKGRGFQILAAHLSDEAVDFREIDYTQPTAVLVGAEKFGVSEEAQRKADRHIKIPMVGMVRSLNVSVATALILFEAQRQRIEAGFYDRRRLDEATYRRLLQAWTAPKRAFSLSEEARQVKQAKEVSEHFTAAGLTGESPL